MLTQVKFLSLCTNHRQCVLHCGANRNKRVIFHEMKRFILYIWSFFVRSGNRSKLQLSACSTILIP